MTGEHVRAIVCAALALAFACAAGPAGAKPNVQMADERAVVAAVTDLWQGWERGDRRQVERNLAAVYVDVDFDGVRREKPEVLGYVQPPPPEQAVAITTRDHKVLFLREGVAQATYNVEDCRGGADRRACFRFTASDTFLHERGGWKLAAGQQISRPAAAPDLAEQSRAEIAAVLREIAAAQIKNDVDGFTRLHVEDWRLTHGRGLVVDRTAFANDMRTFWKPSSIDYAEQSIRLGRDSAVVEGVVTFKWRDAKGKAREAVERHVDVFVREFGRWRRSASTLSCIRGACA